MSVRNFWISADLLDGGPRGRSRRIESGPQGKAGAIDATLFVRHEGESVAALSVKGVAEGGDLIVEIVPATRYAEDGSHPPKKIVLKFKR